MRVLVVHPGLASCADCQKFMVGRDGRLVKSGTTGEPIPRRPGSPTPCKPCPKGPEPFKLELSPRNRQAYWYYRQCQADTTGVLPRDALTVRNNALIKMVEEAVDRQYLASLQQLTPLFKGTMQ